MISSSIVVEVMGSRPVVGSSYSRMPGLHRHRARNRDAPPLSTRELGRPSVDERREPDEPQHFLDAFSDGVERLVRFFIELVADVFGHRQ